MKKFRLILPLIAATTSLSACWIEFGDKEENVNAYYKGYDLTLRGDRLANELQKQCFDKHTQWILYSQVGHYYSKTEDRNSVESVEDGSKVNEWFYTGKQKAGTSGGNREHVWPCANSNGLWVHNNTAGSHYVDGTGYFGGGSDLYHVRLANGTVNTARGNSKFVDFDDSEMAAKRESVATIGEKDGKYSLKIQGYEVTESGTYQYSQLCEPADEVKGDVARNILYVWLHYCERGVTPKGEATAHLGSSKTYTCSYSNMTGALTFTSIMGYTSDERCKETLVKWNNMDKPSAVEKLRNKTVQKIQGNRNPFVDHPELVEQMIG